MTSQHYQVAQQTNADSLIELYSLDISPLGGPVYYWTPGNIGGANVRFAGIEYTPMPIEITGLEWNGQGKLPQPKLSVSNVGNFASGLAIAYGDLRGAIVTRTRTFAMFLDGQPNASPSAVFEPDIFVIDRKSKHNKQELEFELAAKHDQQGILLPKRQAVRDTCTHTYRQYINGFFQYGSCPYAGGNWFKKDGTGTSDPREDVCGKRLSDCKLRFGNAPLPTRAFPGMALISA